MIVAHMNFGHCHLTLYLKAVLVCVLQPWLLVAIKQAAKSIVVANLAYSALTCSVWTLDLNQLDPLLSTTDHAIRRSS